MDNDGKAHCVIITARVDMNLIVVCERIMELQLSKKKSDESDDDEQNLIIKILDLDGGWCLLLMLFWRSLSGHIIFCIVFQI